MLVSSTLVSIREAVQSVVWGGCFISARTVASSCEGAKEGGGLWRGLSKEGVLPPGELMKQPGEIANWLVEWQAGLPASAKVFIGNYTYLDGDLHVKLALCADYCITRLRKARPSTGVAFLCTPTDIHVRTDASDAAARKNYGLGLGSLGFEKLANLLSGGKFLAKVCAEHVPREASPRWSALVVAFAFAHVWHARVERRRCRFETGALCRARFPTPPGLWCRISTTPCTPRAVRASSWLMDSR